MSELTGSLEGLKEAATDLGTNFRADAQAINESRGTISGALQETTHATEYVAHSIERVGRVLGTLSTSETTTGVLGQQVSTHVDAAHELLSSATDVLDGTKNAHASSALTHMRSAKAEADSSIKKCTQVQEETLAAIRLAIGLHETLGTIRNTLTELGEKVETMIAASVGAATDARNVTLQTNLIAEELNAYQRDIE